MKQTIAPGKLDKKTMHDKEEEALRSLNEALKEASDSLRDALDKAEKENI